MPLLVPGVVLGALGFGLSVLMTDYWAAKFAIAVSLAIVMFWIGESGWGFVSVGAAALSVVGAVREWRRS
jgi:hypothetical protein